MADLFDAQAYTAQLWVLIANEIMQRHNGLVCYANNLGDDTPRKYFAFKLNQGSLDNLHPDDVRLSLRGVQDVIMADRPSYGCKIFIEVCKVEMARPYDCFADAVKGVVRYKFVKQEVE